MSMTRTEAEQQVRVIQRTCRGLPLLSEERRTELHTQWQAALKVRDADAATKVVQDVEEAIKKPYRPAFVKEDWQSLFERAAAGIFAYSESCGRDFNDIICAGPFDGQEHEYTCPGCGQTGTYRAPFFEIA